MSFARFGADSDVYVYDFGPDDGPSAYVTSVANRGLRYDGHGDFWDGTATECAARLEHLRDVGYLIPQDAIDELRTVQENT